MWPWSKPMRYGHGIERVFEGLRSADGIALLTWPRPSAYGRPGLARPGILLLEGVFEARATWSSLLASGSLARRALRRTDRHALQPPQDPCAAPGVSQDELGMNRLGFARLLLRSLGASERPPPGRDEISLTHFSDADGPWA